MTPRSISTLLASLLLLVVARTPAAAQTASEMSHIAGHTYVIAYPDTTQNTFDERFKAKQIADTIAMFIYSPVATKVRITGNGYNNVVQVQAKRFAEVYLNGSSNKAAAPIVTQSNIESRNVFRLEADDPVVVYCYIATKFGCEAWTPTAVEMWGQEYIAAALPGGVVKDIKAQQHTSYPTTNRPAPAEITVISAYDNTQVTIIPADTGQLAGSPILSFTLGADRAYQVQSRVDTTEGAPQIDLTGARIVATRPIAVMSGTTRLFLVTDSVDGLARNSLKNLAVEWLAPIEQHGTEFVETPVMDDRALLGQPAETVAEKRRSDHARIVAGEAGSTVVWRTGNTSSPPRIDTLSPHRFLDDTLTGVSVERARVYSTSTPAQGIIAAASISKNLYATDLNVSYDTWGGFMTTMVPRQQWVTFAPFIAPVHPGAMKHYVNIVTDTTSRLKIVDENNATVTGWLTIPGTDICWTYRSVTPGITKFFKAADSTARFYACAYGLLKGHEEFRPRSSSEYEEYIAAAYGYPLASNHAVLRSPDSLTINTSGECDSMVVEITAINGPDGPAGFRTIELVAGSVNTRLTFIDPVRASDVLGRSYAKLKLVAVDKKLDAQGTLRITDRTGAETNVPYSYQAERVSISPSSIVDYGEVTQNMSADTTITITNSLSRPVSVLDISMFFRGAQPFVILEPTPPTPNNPLILQPGENMSIRVRFTPTQENTLYVDTLIVKLGCASVRLPVRGETVLPCIYMGDLNFGTFVLGEDGPKTLPLRICNEGRGIIKFSTTPGADSVVTWLLKNFSVPRSTIDSLRDVVVLGPRGSGTECFTLFVTFTPQTAGAFSTIARFNNNSTCLRDSSIWRATVTQSSGVAWSTVADGPATITPVPAGDRAEVALQLLNRGTVALTLLDARGVPVQQSERLYNAGNTLLPLDLRNLPSGLYYCRLSINGAVQTLPIVVAR